MDIRATVTGFRGAAPLAGLDDAWHWSPAPGIDFAAALSADGKRLLQMSARDSYDEALAVAALRFAREREEQMFARNRFLGVAEGFEPPSGPGFDAVAGVPVEVHDHYAFDHPKLNPLVRVVFPAYACEFSGTEDLKDAETRYLKMLRTNKLDREALPYLRMRFANTKTGGRSTNPGRGLTEPKRLVEELEWMDGAPGSFVEFENRHGRVWRVEWDGTWFLAEEGAEDSTRQEFALDDLVRFAKDRLYE